MLGQNTVPARNKPILKNKASHRPEVKAYILSGSPATVAKLSAGFVMHGMKKITDPN